MSVILNTIKNPAIQAIADKVCDGTRISTSEALMLYEQAELPTLGALASVIRRRINGNDAFYNRNFHIEPSNKCAFNCMFCSYHKAEGDPGSWEYTPEEMLDIVKSFDTKQVTEVHIVGGANPNHDLFYYSDLISKIKEHRPSLHIKAFSAVELDYMSREAKISTLEGLQILKKAGLQSIPGGGAEIFDEEIRGKICPDKASSKTWLSIHQTAHEMGIPSNATMLYGHVETYSHRVDHLNRLRELQDKTGGFNAFIPLKYKSGNNRLSYVGEVSVIEDLRNYAVSRIFLDNIPHLKAYWPMAGRELAQVALSFGADDLDGTIDDTTKIYSMAGSGEQNPSMTTDEITKLIQEAGFNPVERDSYYKPIKG